MFANFMFTRFVPTIEIFVVLQEASLMPFKKSQNQTNYEQ